MNYILFCFTFRILVPCQLGYAIICNSSKSSEEKTSICPADNFVKLHFEIKTFLPFFNFRILGIPRILFAAVCPSHSSLLTLLREEILLEGAMISASRWILTSSPTVQSMVTVKCINLVILNSFDTPKAYLVFIKSEP